MSRHAVPPRTSGSHVCRHDGSRLSHSTALTPKVSPTTPKRVLCCSPKKSRGPDCSAAQCSAAPSCLVTGYTQHVSAPCFERAAREAYIGRARRGRAARNAPGMGMASMAWHGEACAKSSASRVEWSGSKHATELARSLAALPSGKQADRRWAQAALRSAKRSVLSVPSRPGGMLLSRSSWTCRGHRLYTYSYPTLPLPLGYGLG